MIDWYSATVAITAQVKAIPNRQFDVFEHDVPDGYIPTTYGETIRPYVILLYAGVTDVRTGESIVGPQADDMEGTFTVHSVASTDADARYLNQMVLNNLVGWSPPSCGVIRPAFFAGVGSASKLSAPTRYAASQAYKVLNTQ